MIGLVIALGAAAILGAALIVLGIRGRRIDDHPVCRQCQFDLVGVYPAVLNCPECGTTLSDKAVRLGRRRKIRSIVAAGAALLLVAAGWGGVLGWGWAAGFNWNTVKPAWWLQAELSLSSAPLRMPR